MLILKFHPGMKCLHVFFSFFHPCLSSRDEFSYRQKRVNSKSAFTCNQDEISSPDETRPWMKKCLFTSEFHPRMKRVEFHPEMKFNLKENLPLSMKTCNEIYHSYVKTSDDYFFRKVTLFIIFVCLFSY